MGDELSRALFGFSTPASSRRRAQATVPRGVRRNLIPRASAIAAPQRYTADSASVEPFQSLMRLPMRKAPTATKAKKKLAESNTVPVRRLARPGATRTLSISAVVTRIYIVRPRRGLEWYASITRRAERSRHRKMLRACSVDRKRRSTALPTRGRCRRSASQQVPTVGWALVWPFACSSIARQRISS
jgi:hypothetical protein